MTGRAPQPPKHLKPATQRWWATAVAEFEFEAHHLMQLTLAGEHWDRNAVARETIATHGLTFEDRFGSPRERPEVKIAKDSAIVFARLIRELRLDISAPDARPPGLGA